MTDEPGRDDPARMRLTRRQTAACTVFLSLALAGVLLTVVTHHNTLGSLITFVGVLGNGIVLTRSFIRHW